VTRWDSPRIALRSACGKQHLRRIIYVLHVDKTVYGDGASEEATWLALHSPGGAIHRAMSCDSVTSEASISEFDHVDDVANKIGQLEFSLQYLRYAAALLGLIIRLHRMHMHNMRTAAIHALGGCQSVILSVMRLRGAKKAEWTECLLGVGTFGEFLTRI